MLVRVFGVLRECPITCDHRDKCPGNSCDWLELYQEKIRDDYKYYKKEVKNEDSSI